MKTTAITPSEQQVAIQFLRHILIKEKAKSTSLCHFSFSYQLHFLKWRLRYEQFRLGSDALSLYLIKKERELTKNNPNYHHITMALPIKNWLQLVAILLQATKKV